MLNYLISDYVKDNIEIQGGKGEEGGGRGRKGEEGGGRGRKGEEGGGRGRKGEEEKIQLHYVVVTQY